MQILFLTQVILLDNSFHELYIKASSSLNPGAKFSLDYFCLKDNFILAPKLIMKLKYVSFYIKPCLAKDKAITSIQNNGKYMNLVIML